MVKRGTRKTTYSQERYPETQDFVILAKNFSSDAIIKLWNFVWQGYDNYYQEILEPINLSKDYGEIEREITQDLAVDIQRIMPSLGSFVLQHERYEMENTNTTPGRPKQPDLVFVLYSNRRISYPIEAKVLSSDGEVAEYIKEINENFLTCRYAPFSSEGGMLGYLLKGSPDQAFTNIEKKTPCTLSDHPDFPNRHHKISDHQRSIPESKPYPLNFRCHHLILEVMGASQ
ncbi:MAG: hypothetical protein AB4060_01735 [Crocosphaera sp.]